MNRLKSKNNRSLNVMQICHISLRFVFYSLFGKHWLVNQLVVTFGILEDVKSLVFVVNALYLGLSGDPLARLIQAFLLRRPAHPEIFRLFDIIRIFFGV